jgi:hypothetical protein
VGQSEISDTRGRVASAAAERATAPARWLLELADDGGAPLTQTYALARAVVREAAERWPHWWNAELFGAPHREADLALLEALHDGLRRLRLVRRRGRTLLATTRGRKLVDDPLALLYELAGDLGRGDPFTAVVADVVIDRLSTSAPCTHDELVAPAVRAAALGGWRDPSGNPPGEQHVSWYVGDVLRRGEAYGLIDRNRDPDDPKSWRSLISLSPAAPLVLGGLDEVSGRVIFVFDAELVSGMAIQVQGVSARIAVASHEHLTALHAAIQQAFGWGDDHLYSFWLDARFWGDDRTEYVRPGTPDSENTTADVPVEELGLGVGAKIAYVFDYGDEWRVMLTVRERLDGEEPVRRVIERRGAAPPQYPPLEE